jgi:hypothetical protein
MPFAVLSIPSDGRFTVGGFSLSGPKDLKDRISHAFLHAHDQRVDWEGQNGRIMWNPQGTYGISCECELHALLNVIEASGWKLTHATELRCIFEKV